jgi:hypothetical protein
MKRALGKPAILTIAVLVIVTASGLLLRSNTGSAKTPPPSDADEPSVKATGTRIAAENPSASPVVAGSGDHATTGSTAAKPRENPRAVEAAAARESPRAAVDPKNLGDSRQLLETVGTLTAAHLYQSYFNINFLSDGRAKGIYTDKEATQLLDSVLSVVDSVDRKLAALGKIELDREDHDSLEQMRDISDLLHRQGRQLQTYWESHNEADAAKYEEFRKDSWAAISRLMGMGR